MKLSKQIPATTKTIEFNWVAKDFLQVTEQYRKIRIRFSDSSMLKCDWCEHKFENEEWISLAQPKSRQEGPKRNWALCSNCADLIEED